MKTIMPEAVASVFLEIVERLSFMFGEEVPKTDLPNCGESCLQAVQTFWGDSEGWIMLVVPESVAGEIARNILGLGDGDCARAEIVDDSVTELLNVISGHMVCAVSEEKTDIRLAPPTLNRLSPEAARAMREDPQTMGFLSEGYPVLFGMGSGRQGA